jgi:FAD/FMN-containing dehydrogenase
MTDMRSDVIDNFRSKLRGRLVQPSDPEYDQARTIWNAMIDRRPALIVRCAGAADVIASVTFAREHSLPLAVRGGGHNIAGSALCDDGLVIDLSAMRSVRVDPAQRRAWVEGGATLHDFDHEAQAFALAVPLGINSTTGVGGLALGGGFGWLSRMMGLTIDHLAGADIVTADSQLRHASAGDEPDLFWAIRGGGGNFGVVTTFEFALEPVGPEVTAGLIVFPLDQAKAVMTRYRDMVNTMGTDLAVWAVLRHAPPLPFLAPEVHGQAILALAVFSPRKLDEVAPCIDTLRGFGQAAGEHIGPVPYTAWQQVFDPLLTPGARNYWKSHNFSALSDAAIDTVIGYAGQLPTPQCEIFLGLLGGKASEPAPDATAYPHRDALYVMNVHTRWESAADDARCIAWAREFFKASAPFAAAGVYSNFMAQDEGARIGDAYGKNLDRLVEIKTRYDPHNLFRNNQNIPPRPA